jgi:hypothetical protein
MIAEHKNFSGILQLRQHYLRVFQRKLAAIGCSLTSYSEFRRTLKKVRIFANLLQTFVQ